MASTFSVEAVPARTKRSGSWWRTKGISIVPLVGDALAMLRLLSDKRASFWAKLVVVAAIGYVVCPIDLIPDAIPFFGWLDDAGIVIAMRLALHRQLEPYRYPLFGGHPPVAELGNPGSA